MKNIEPFNSEIHNSIVYTLVAFLLMALVLVVFFYISRKRIIRNEVEKKNAVIEHQKELLKVSYEVQEEERNRIAQDLHDDINSKLNVISLSCNLLKTNNITVEERKEILNNLFIVINKTIDSTRRISHNLLPPVLDKFGVHAAIEELIAEYHQSRNIEISYTNNVDLSVYGKKEHLQLFRIIQELISNSVKHGCANKITLQFNNQKNDRIQFTFKDNGFGFGNTEIMLKKGLGLQNIENRVSILKGTLKINPKVVEGVHLTIIF